MTKLIIQVIMLLFCLSSIGQSTTLNSAHPLDLTATEGKQNLSITNLSILNSAYHDYCPVYFDDGILFTSDRIESGSMKRADANFYFSAFGNDGQHQEPILYESKLNSKFQEGIAAISPDGKTLVFSREIKQVQESNVLNDVRLYTATFTNGVWGNLKKMSINVKGYSSGHPAFSADGTELYFVSNRPGGFGGTDIYVSKLKKRKWGKPKNLGSIVNTSKNELFPFIDQNGILYFSANKKSGFGVLDIYMSSLNDNGIWIDPINMGEPINSSGNDFGFYKNLSDETGYFSSNRAGGLGGNDIYFWSIENNEEKENCVALSCELTNEDGEHFNTERAEVQIFNLDNKIESQSFTIDNGSLDYCLECGFDFVIKVVCQNYYLEEAFVSTKNILCNKQEKLSIKMKMNHILEEESTGNGINMNSLDSLPEKINEKSRNEEKKNMLESISTLEMVDDIELEESKSDQEENNLLLNDEIKTKETINNTPTELPTIYYDFDSYQIREADEKYLEDLAIYLNSNPTLKLSINSYTDPKGKKAYNKWLSKRRAEMVMTYLVKTGIEESRLIPKGKGEIGEEQDFQSTSAQNDNYSNYRRTEFEIINSEEKLENINNSSESNPLKKVELHNTVLTNIFYEFDSFVLNENSSLEVDNLIAQIKDNPDHKVEIRSHTDSRGSKNYNQKLSQKRANEVVRYIISKGIDPSRLVAKGFGESELINHCSDGVTCSKDEHKKNRRTEFVFID
jgi:outer membrane protein OmpA-like peptidoglycan-associated protein